MIYIVECNISDPKVEAEWNAYYTERKLDEVLSVPGFRTSQRFKSVEPRPDPYFAMHTVDSLDVLTGEAYRSGGGGRFNERFQPYIINWHRRLFNGLDRAPSVPEGELLAVADEKRDMLDIDGVRLDWMWANGLDASVPYRGIARVTPEEGKRLVEKSKRVVRLYRPLTAQRVEHAGKSAPVTKS